MVNKGQRRKGDKGTKGIKIQAKMVRYEKSFPVNFNWLLH
jgi:hypothetical protein